MLQWLQTIGAQGIAGVDQIDDTIGQADQRCQFHRAIEFDDLHLLAQAGVVTAGGMHEFGGDLHPPGRFGLADRASHHQAATGDIQIQGFI